MATDDFEVDSLAAYLHLLPAQVLRLAERGKLPGRRVAGQWRFSQAEIHHWLEQRIGLSDQDELVQMEDMLERTAPAAADRPIALADLLSIEAIEIPLKARTRSSVIKNMAALAARSGLLWDADKMADASNSGAELRRSRHHIRGNTVWRRTRHIDRRVFFDRRRQ